MNAALRIQVRIIATQALAQMKMLNAQFKSMMRTSAGPMITSFDSLAAAMKKITIQAQNAGQATRRALEGTSAGAASRPSFIDVKPEKIASINKSLASMSSNAMKANKATTGQINSINKGLANYSKNALNAVRITPAQVNSANKGIKKMVGDQVKAATAQQTQFQKINKNLFNFSKNALNNARVSPGQINAANRGIKQMLNAQAKAVAQAQKLQAAQAAKAAAAQQRAAVAAAKAQARAVATAQRQASISTAATGATTATNQMAGAFERGRRSLLSMGKSIQSAGRQLTYNFTYPLVTAGKKILGFALDNERALTRLQKVYGDASTGAQQFADDQAKLALVFRKLSDIYGMAQSDVIDLAAAWAAAGATGYDLAKAVQTTMEALTLGDFSSQEEAVQSLIAVQTAYKLNAGQLQQALYDLNAVENQTAVSFTDLVRGFVRVGSVAASAGVGVRELSAMIAALVPTTGSAETAGNGLKTIITRVMAPTTEAIKAMHQLGIEFESASFQGLNATQRLEKLAVAFKDLTDSQKVATATMIAGRFQANRFVELMEQMLPGAASAFNKAMAATADQMTVVAGAQREINTILMSSPQAFQILQTRIQNMLVSVITPLIPTLLQVTAAIERMVKAFADLPQHTRNLILFSLALLAIIGPITRVAGAFVELFSIIGHVVGFLGGAFRAILIGTGEELGGLVGLLVNPWVLAFIAIVAAAIIFRKQLAKIFQSIGDWINNHFPKFSETIVNAFHKLPQGVQESLLAVLRIVKTIVMKIWEWLSYLNPFARHSPSLVEQVDAGVAAIMASYSKLSGIGSIFARASKDLEAFKQATAGIADDLEQAQRTETKQTLVAAAPAAGPSVDAVYASIDRLKGVMKELTAEYAKQKKVVDSLSISLAQAQKEYDDQNDLLTTMKDNLDLIQTSLSAAKDQLDNFANAPIAGMKAMDEQIFQNEMHQKALRLEILKLEDAGKSYDDLTAKINALQGELEAVQGRQAELRAGGAGSDILGFYDDQVKALMQQQRAYQNQLAPIQNLQDQLDSLGHTAEELDLEKSLKFDPLTHQIQNMIDTTKEMSFDDIVAGIQKTKPQVDALTQAYNDQNDKITAQQAVVDQYKGKLDEVQKVYDTEKKKLDDLGDAYDAAETNVNLLQSALDDLASAYKSSQDAAAAANFDKPLVDGLNAGGDLDSMLKDLDQQMKDMFGKLDIFGGFKKKWHEFQNWWNANIVPDWQKLIEGLKSTWQYAFGNLDFSGIASKFRDGLTSIWDEIKKHPAFGELKKLFSQFGQDIGPVLQDVWARIKDFAGKLQTELEKWKDLWEPFKKSVRNLAIFLAASLVPIIEILRVVEAIWKEAFGPAVQTILDDIVDHLEILHQALKLIFDLLSGNWKDLPKDLENLGLAIYNWGFDLGRNLWNLFGHIFVGLFRGLWREAEDLKKIGDKVRGWITGGINHAIDWLEQAGRDIFKGLWNGLLNMWNQLWDFFFGHSIKSWIVGYFSDALNWLVDAGMNILKGLWNGLVTAWNASVSFFGNIGTAIVNAFSAAGSWLIGAGSAIISGLWNGMVLAWNASVGFLDGVKNAVVGFFGDALSWLGAAGGNIITGLWGGIQAVWDSGVGFFTGLKDKIVGFFATPLTWLEDIGKDILTGLKNGVDKGWDLVKTWFSTIKQKIKDFISNPLDILKDVGERVIEGFKKGLENGWRKYNPYQWFKDRLKDITDLWPFSPAKEGPLRDHPPEQAGSKIGELFALGLAGNEQQIKTVAASLATAAQQGLDSEGLTMTSVIQPGDINAAQTKAQTVGASIATSIQNTFGNVINAIHNGFANVNTDADTAETKMANLKTAVDTAFEGVETAYGAFIKPIQDDQTFKNLLTQVDAYKNGTNTDLNQLKLNVDDYAFHVLHVPLTRLTQFNAWMDAGQVDRVLQSMQIMASNARISAQIIAQGGAGYETIGQIDPTTGRRLNTRSQHGSPPGGAVGGMTLVGEKGPELVVLPQGSIVKTHYQTNQLFTHIRRIDEYLQHARAEGTAPAPKRALMPHVRLAAPISGASAMKAANGSPPGGIRTRAVNGSPPGGLRGGYIGKTGLPPHRRITAVDSDTARLLSQMRRVGQFVRAVATRTRRTTPIPPKAYVPKVSAGSPIAGPPLALAAAGSSGLPGGLTLMGERGPELTVMPRGSIVRTHNETNKLFSNISRITEQPAQSVSTTKVTNTVNINGNLEFPNITKKDDAEAFIRNLEALATT